MPKKSAAEEPLLTLPELAGYLHLDEKTAFKLAASGKIPGVQIGGHWRFRRTVVEDWLEQQLTQGEESFEDAPDGMKVPLDELLPDTAIIPDLRARDPISVIEELAGRAYASNWLFDKPWFVGAVVEREALASTAMEGGVAFLHTRAKDKGKIARPFIICGRSWNGIPFGAPDGRPTYLFFLLGLKYDKLHLPVLGRLARALRNPATIAKLRSMSSTGPIRALLLKEDAAVRAGIAPPPLAPGAFEPKLDRQLRLRAIRRVSHAHAQEKAKLDDTGPGAKSAKSGAKRASRARKPKKS